MPDIKVWLEAPNPITNLATEKAQRAALAWRRIQAKPTSVVFKTAAGVAIAAQTVRVESDSRATVSKSVAGAAPRRKAIVFGIRDHATLANTDIKEGYTFNLETDKYVVQDVIITLGEVQGIAEATR